MAIGHVRRRGKRYVVVMELPKHPTTGRRQQYWSPSVRTRKEAEALQIKLQHEMNTGAFVLPSDQPLGAYLDEWIEKRLVAGKLRVSTAEEYRYKLNSHIIPTIGGLTLAQIQPKHIDAWLMGLRKKGLAERTVMGIYSLVNGGLRAAVQLDLRASNPCDKVESPQPRDERRAVWDDAQAQRFRDLIRGEPLEIAFLIVLGTGLRKGEVLGLRWSDVDLARGTIVVLRQQTYTMARKIAYDKPKTDAGQRSMKLPPFALDALKAHRGRAAGGGEGNVFRDRHGGPLKMYQLEWAWRQIRKRAVAAGLPYITFHDLRHVHATVALVAGVAPKVLSKRLGHTKISTTYDMYVHVPDSLDALAADQIGAVFGGDLPPIDPPSGGQK